jgi:hypothetical protein
VTNYDDIEKPGYDYEVPSQHQGAYSSLRVIGDKRGGGTAHLLAQHPELLPQLKELVEVPLKVIHVTRHPFDNISTIARKHHGGDVNAAIDQWTHLFEGVQAATRYVAKDHWKTISHEKLIDNPESVLSDTCAFLGVDSPVTYLSDCSGIIFTSPSKSREKVSYSQHQLERIRKVSSSYSFLDRYDFGV